MGDVFCFNGFAWFNMGRITKNDRCLIKTIKTTPSLGVNPSEFLDERFMPKTGVLGLFVVEDFMILACVVLTQ